MPIGLLDHARDRVDHVGLERVLLVLEAEFAEELQRLQLRRRTRRHQRRTQLAQSRRRLS